MPNEIQKLLIVDDSRLNIKLIAELFKDDYEVIVARDGRQALKRVKSNPPDLILLDIMMPEMDGYEVCQRLKENPETKDIPIVFLSSMSDADNEYRGLDLGAIDYIKKPIKTPLIKARVNNFMKLRAAMVKLDELHKLALDANPNTGLPGNNTVNKRITQVLANNAPKCVLYADLDHFKAFNDTYGFARGDAVIQFTAGVLKKVVESCGCDDAFIGHIGGDDFVLLVPSEKSQNVADEMIRRFDEGVADFYNSEDAQANYIRTCDRQGRSVKFPLMSISIAGVDLAQRKFQRYLEVNDACTEIKKKAKETPGSCFIMDRRVD